MRKFSTLKRGPTGHARMATALAAVGALVMSGGLVMLGASTATAGTGRSTSPTSASGSSEAW